jgi:hypothetical protein
MSSGAGTVNIHLLERSQLVRRLINPFGQPRQSFRQSLGQIPTIGDKCRLVLAIHGSLQRPFSRAFVGDCSRSIRSSPFLRHDGWYRERFLPGGAGRRLSWEPLLKDHDVRCDLGMGIFEESRVGQPNGGDEISLFGQVLLADRRSCLSSVPLLVMKKTSPTGTNSLHDAAKK